MNNKGFTLMELLATIIIMAFILIIIFPSIQKLINTTDEKKYQTYEDMMVEYAMVNEDKTSTIFNLNELDELNDVKKNCIGYVTVNRQTNNYKAYIKCTDKYTTEGFDSTKIN